MLIKNTSKKIKDYLNLKLKEEVENLYCEVKTFKTCFEFCSTIMVLKDKEAYHERENYNMINS